jgi:hypothetical protein
MHFMLRQEIVWYFTVQGTIFNYEHTNEVGTETESQNYSLMSSNYADETSEFLSLLDTKPSILTLTRFLGVLTSKRPTNAESLF